MCVLNASQLHWTSETEELLLEQGGEAPQTMLTRQVPDHALLEGILRVDLSMMTTISSGIIVLVMVPLSRVLKVR